MRIRLMLTVLSSMVAVGVLAGPAAVAAPVELDLSFLGRTEAKGETAAEISTFDPTTKRVFVTNALDNTLDVFDISDPADPQELDSVDLDAFGGLANSVDFTAAHGGLIAIAMESVPKTDAGQVVFLDSDLGFLDSFRVGAQPDMLIFSEDGARLLVANEGEPSADGTINPEGSVTIFDLVDGLDDIRRRTAGFNGVPIDDDVRIFSPGATVAQDLEPEYIAVHGDRAWVSIQEANAVGILDLETGKFTSVRSLGFKDHGAAGNELDVNDQNGISLASWPNLYGMYQPDAIAAYAIPETRTETTLKPKRDCNAGKPKKPKPSASAKVRKSYKNKLAKFKKKKARCQEWNRTKREVTKTITEDVVRIATANEGDARDWAYYAEESRVNALTLDPAAFPAGTGSNAQLGRLNVTTSKGDTDNDGDFDELYVFGGRSMSLLDADGTMVYDTGNQMETFTSTVAGGTMFNLDHANNLTIDNRSDNKGPEPEGIAIGEVGGRIYAFVGLERQGGILAYDLSEEPGAAHFAGYINTRQADRGPEDVDFIPAASSPTGKPIVTYTSEITGTVAFVEVQPATS